MSQNTSEAAWYCQTPSGQQGPFSQTQMQQMIDDGRLGRGVYVWRQGFANWTLLGEVDDFALPDAAPAAGGGSGGGVTQAEDDYLDSVFTGLVKKSWTRFNKRQRAGEVDEVLVGAVIASTLENGYSLIDLESTGQAHHLRFEDTATGNRIIFRLEHQAESLITASVIGHEALVTIGYGERVEDFKSVWRAVKQELKGGYILRPDPGVITVDGDMSSRYVYVEVGLIWDIDDYLDGEGSYRVRSEDMTRDIGATLHALRKYLRGRLRLASQG